MHTHTHNQYMVRCTKCIFYNIIIVLSPFSPSLNYEYVQPHSCHSPIQRSRLVVLFYAFRTWFRCTMHVYKCALCACNAYNCTLYNVGCVFGINITIGAWTAHTICRHQQRPTWPVRNQYGSGPTTESTLRIGTSIGTPKILCILYVRYTLHTSSSSMHIQMHIYVIPPRWAPNGHSAIFFRVYFACVICWMCTFRASPVSKYPKIRNCTIKRWNAYECIAHRISRRAAFSVGSTLLLAPAIARTSNTHTYSHNSSLGPFLCISYTDDRIKSNTLYIYRYFRIEHHIEALCLGNGHNTQR